VSRSRPADAPRLRPRWRDVVGKAWNAPNTAIGIVYGGLGLAVGRLARALRGGPAPGVRWRDNAIQFTHNPLGGAGAITIGNTMTCRGDPDDPDCPFWYPKRAYPDGVDPRTFENGHSIGEHEAQHTYQGEMLGPAYLPSNLLGGLNALLHGESWHGPHNWNERGPQGDPPRPWAPRARGPR
jgi:hypothetical protein